MNEKHYELVRAGVEKFNAWRESHPQEEIDLSGADLSCMKLDEIDLSDAQVYNANLCSCSLIGANFRRANLSNAGFNFSDCRHAWFEGAICSKARFIKADLSKASFNFAYLDGADFTGANLSFASLREAYMSRAILDEANTAKTDFWGVDLTNVYTGRVNLTKAKMPKDFSVNRRNFLYLEKQALIILNVIVVIIVIILMGSIYKKTTQKFGDPGATIGSFLNYSIGNMYLSKGKTKDAIKYYQLAIKAKPDEPIYYFRMAQAYDDLGDNDKATEYYNKFVAMKPNVNKIQEIEIMLDKNKSKVSSKLKPIIKEKKGEDVKLRIPSKIDL